MVDARPIDTFEIIHGIDFLLDLDIVLDWMANHTPREGFYFA